MVTLRRCHSCGNTINAESEACPICGVSPRAWIIKLTLTGSALLGVAAWAAMHWVR